MKPRPDKKYSSELPLSVAIAVPELRKKPGLYYAVTDDGIELPIIDITHPAFSFHMSDAEWKACTAQTVRVWESRFRMALFRFVLARYSVLIQKGMQTSGTFMNGIDTYMWKLGPDNLGRGYANALDRRFASNLVAATMRQRLQDFAQLIAAGLNSILARRNHRVEMINIAGGTATDSLNALLLIRKHNPEWRCGPIHIHVLDVDARAPHFGSRCVEALRGQGAPLHDLDISLSRSDYDWNDTARLRELLREANKEDPIAVGSSEGGLFDYGSNRAILENLTAIRDGTPKDFVFVGSLSLDEEITRLMLEASKSTLRLFKWPDFQHLVERTGWRIDCVLDTAPTYRVFKLSKA